MCVSGPSPRSGAARRHLPFLALLLAGATLRVATLVAFRPALMFYGDSYDYVRNAERLRPDTLRPLGYALLLRPLSWTGSLLAVPVAQHLLGLLLGVGVYVVARRWGLGRWTGALAAAPALLDAWVLSLEQFVLSETLFSVVVLVAIGLLVWSPRPSVTVCAIAGALLAAAALTRIVGLVLLAPVLVVVVLSRWGGKRPLALAVAAGAVLIGYGSWYGRTYDGFGFTALGPRLLYGRVAVFADCSRVRVPEREQALCPPPDRPRMTAGDYTWSPSSPYRQLARQPGGAVASDVQDFDRRVLLAQPGAWARTTFSDLADYLDPNGDHPFGGHVATWELLPVRHRALGNAFVAPNRFADAATVRVRPPRPEAAVAHPPAGVLRAYQRAEHLPGPFIVAGLLAGLAGLVLARGPHAGHQRRAIALPVLAGAALLVATAATSAFDYRYLVGVLLLVWPAGVLGAVRAADRFRRGPGPAGTRPGSDRAGFGVRTGPGVQPRQRAVPGLASGGSRPSPRAGRSARPWAGAC